MAVECPAFYMERRPDTIAARARGAAIACGVALALAVVMTWPLAAGLGRLGRTTTMDGLYGIWNVAWVRARIVTDPASLFDANIFYPHRDTLAYSEANIVAGVVGIPAWLLTHNAYAAHNSALLFAFASTFLGTWLLARQLSATRGRRRSSPRSSSRSVPYFFSHSAHIQLLMAGGIPLSMLALHRLADAPSPARGVVLGVALATQALACAYYGIFAGLMVGYGVLFFAARRRLWRDRAFWIAVALGAVVAGLIVLPFFLPVSRAAARRRLRAIAGRRAAVFGDVAELPGVAGARASAVLVAGAATRLAHRRSAVPWRSSPSCLARRRGTRAGARDRSGDAQQPTIAKR